MSEKNDTDGKTYTVQYFERAVFEAHPENKAPFDVLLSLLGVFSLNRYHANGVPDQKASTDNALKFDKVSQVVGGKFRAYWEANGGLAQQGYPITDEFQERNLTRRQDLHRPIFRACRLRATPRERGQAERSAYCPSWAVSLQQEACIGRRADNSRHAHRYLRLPRRLWPDD